MEIKWYLLIISITIIDRRNVSFFFTFDLISHDYCLRLHNECSYAHECLLLVIGPLPDNCLTNKPNFLYFGSLHFFRYELKIHWKAVKSVSLTAHPDESFANPFQMHNTFRWDFSCWTVCVSEEVNILTKAEKFEQFIFIFVKSRYIKSICNSATFGILFDI